MVIEFIREQIWYVLQKYNAERSTTKTVKEVIKKTGGLEERIVAELIFYDGTKEAEQLFLSNKRKLYRPQHLAHSIYPFLEHYGMGIPVAADKEKIDYFLNHSTMFLRDGTRKANNYLTEGWKK